MVIGSMLIHKRTLGVLQWTWDGVSYVTFDGVQRPRMKPVTFETYALNREEWWEVPNGTPLARTIAAHYPFFDPVVVEGELVGVEIWPAWKRYGEQEPQAVPPAGTVHRKYNRRRGT